ncbi:glycosyltransferase [Xanthomonas sp. 60]
MIGVLIPAHNEAERIGACLASIQRAALHPALRGEEVHVVVALDSCSDATAWHCARAGVETLSVKVRCVGAARAAAADSLIARGASWLASTDADSLVPADWLVAQREGGHDAFCGVVDLHCANARERRLRRRFVAGERWGDGHGRIHGANLGVSAVAYQRVGGFAAVACHEDVGLVERLRGQGARIAWRGEPRVLTSGRLQGRARGGFADHLRNLQDVALGRETERGTAILAGSIVAVTVA